MHWSAGYPRDPGRQTRSPATGEPSRCNRNTAFWPFAGRGTSLNAMSRLPGNNSVTLALFLRAGDWTISPFNTVCTSIEARNQAGSCSEPVRGISVARAISVTVPCTISAAAAMRWLRCNSGSMATARATSCSVFSSAGKRASSATAISSPCTHAVAKNTNSIPGADRARALLRQPHGNRPPVQITQDRVDQEAPVQTGHGQSRAGRQHAQGRSSRGGDRTREDEARSQDERLGRACFGHGADTFSLCRNTVRAICRGLSSAPPVLRTRKSAGDASIHDRSLMRSP